MVKELITRGASVNLIGYGGSTALHNAVNAKIHKDQLNIVSLLIKNGANINATNNYGFTPLHYSVGSSGKLDITKLLLASGSKPNIKNKFGVTALDMVFIGNEQTALVLKKHGAKKASDL